MIEVRVERKLFPAVAGAPAKQALGACAFRLGARERLALVGPSGCGKSTLLHLVAGLDTAFEGRIARPASLRLAYMFQEPRLLPWRTVEENVRLVMDDPDAERAWLDELFEATGLGGVRAVHPNRLSLGMARRVALVRAFAIRPGLVLLDEPFVSLDAGTGERLRRLVAELLDRHPAAMLLVTHHLDEAVELADRVLVLTPSPGRLAGEARVPLSAAERHDRAGVERCRAAIEALVAAAAAQSSEGR